MHAITEAKARVRFCARCWNVADGELCPICLDERRDSSIICVVEESRDIVAIEKTGEFRGRYHVLLGAMNPLEGIGPEQLKMKELFARIEPEDVQEVILCTNPNTEGEVTAMYIARMMKPFGVRVHAHRQRPARGWRSRVRRRAHARQGPRRPPRRLRLTPTRVPHPRCESHMPVRVAAHRSESVATDPSRCRPTESGLAPRCGVGTRIGSARRRADPKNWLRYHPWSW